MFNSNTDKSDNNNSDAKCKKASFFFVFVTIIGIAFVLVELVSIILGALGS